MLAVLWWLQNAGPNWEAGRNGCEGHCSQACDIGAPLPALRDAPCARGPEASKCPPGALRWKSDCQGDRAAASAAVCGCFLLHEGSIAYAWADAFCENVFFWCLEQVADFGLAHIMQDRKAYEANSVCGELCGDGMLGWRFFLLPVLSAATQNPFYLLVLHEMGRGSRQHLQIV